MRSSIEWRFWGRHDPMWSVATWKGRQANSENPWTPEDFLAAGRSDLADIMRHWNHYGRIEGGTCIEIGCGSGRMTNSLLDHFDRVFGVDISPDQIALARELLGDRLSRVDLRLVDAPVLDVAPMSCTGMLSTHVFQHLSAYSGIVAYLRETYRALTPGASICFQTPVPGAQLGDIPSLHYRTMNWFRTHIGRTLGRRKFMEYNRYPANRIVATLKEIGFDDVEVRIFPLTTTNFRQSFFFARKPAL